ncbi:MAG: phytanoyl-CoA dioxygenase family protein [Blastocatellales bacterium]
MAEVLLTRNNHAVCSEQTGIYVDRIQSDGFALIPSVVPPQTTSFLSSRLAEISSAEVKSRGQSAFGVRKLLKAAPAVGDLARSDEIRALVEPILGAGAFVVRGIFFDKTPDANWKVAWHQDLTITVRRKIEIEGFGSWSVKAGIDHVIPPVEILEKMLALRIHLDDADESNGALKVIPGSHKHGRLNPQQIQALKEERQVVVCSVPAGGVMAMKPLLLHASSASAQPWRRRVIHLEFSAMQLPGGLEWYGS